MNRKTCTLIGAAVGLIAYLVVGIVPAAHFGGYAGALLAGGLVASKTGLVVKALVAFGGALGVLGIGGLFLVAGAVLGAFAALLARAAPEGAEAGGAPGKAA